MTPLQICINRFEIPLEIGYMIKDYTFDTIERMEIKKKRKRINAKIRWGYRDGTISQPVWWFECPTEKRFCATFCENCGDYKQVGFFRQHVPPLACKCNCPF